MLESDAVAIAKQAVADRQVLVEGTVRVKYVSEDDLRKHDAPTIGRPCWLVTFKLAPTKRDSLDATLSEFEKDLVEAYLAEHNRLTIVVYGDGTTEAI